MSKSAPERPRLLVASPEGTVYEHPFLEMALDNGLDLCRPSKKELIAVPEGWDLMAMPGTKPIGYDPQQGTFVTVDTFTVTGKNGKTITFEPRAVAIHPPPGYVRTHHPGAVYLDTLHPDDKLRLLQAQQKNGDPALLKKQREQEKAKEEREKVKEKGGLPILESAGDDGARPGLPLWAYTAVGGTHKGFVAAMFLADETSRWAPSLYYKQEVKEKISKRMALDPENRVLQQLSFCAQEYLCCCAQNIFYERWEGAVPMAPACTAACLGCLSKDPAWETPTPQKRLKFSPTPEEIARIMIHHLDSADEPMISFGQGCEGEPTMNGPVLVESVRLTREKTKRGVININTNGSRPQTVKEAAAAGATALRVSLNTFDPAIWEAYYRPYDYTFETMLETLYVGRDMGMYNSINLLIWPGWTDRMEEIDRISKVVEDGALQMIQLRNLCVDPGHFRTILPPREQRGMLLGLRGFVKELHQRHPKLRFGTFNPRLAADWWDDVPPVATKNL